MYRIGIDIGGTFTDFVLLNDDDATVAIHKQLTTPDDPSRAVLEGISVLLSRQNVVIGQVTEIVHGTTLVTNALIERRGAVTGMIVTEGMRDILDIGRERRYDLFDLRLIFPKPFVPRHLREEISERVWFDGRVETPLDTFRVREAVERLQAKGIEALAICFLHSYANPDHERVAVEIVREMAPGISVCASSDVFPYMREYERWTTTTMNAYVQPVVHRYISRLESELSGRGFAGRLHIMTSSGGMVTADIARRFPIRLLESGPAAGALMSAHHGQALGEKNVLSFDMGGTTAKGALVRDGVPLKKYELEVARVHEFKAGSGLPAKTPVIDLIEIGAGGGSLAEIDERGVIRVGPRSAGAVPGPVCYGAGGETPSLTDANLVLGLLNADFFLGGRMALDVEKAGDSIMTSIAEPLGLDLLRAAWGIHEVVNEDVAQAFRIHASERAFDYRKASMVGFGGSGPMHAVRIARKLRVPKVIFPMGAGVMSAFGLLVSPVSFEIARSHRASMRSLDADCYETEFEPMASDLLVMLTGAGLAADQVFLSRKVDMRYEGQGYEVEVDAGGSLPMLDDRFADAYRKMFSSILPDEEKEIVNWKMEARGPLPFRHGAFAYESLSGRKGVPIKGHRPMYLPEQGRMVPVPVYDRYALHPGAAFVGPALVEEQESTVVIASGDTVEIDDHFNMIVTIYMEEDSK